MNVVARKTREPSPSCRGEQVGWAPFVYRRCFFVCYLPLAGGGEEFHFARCSINSIFNRVDRNYRASPNPSNVDRPVRLREASEKHGGTNRSIILDSLQMPVCKDII